MEVAVEEMDCSNGEYLSPKSPVGHFKVPTTPEIRQYSNVSTGYFTYSFCL